MLTPNSYNRTKTEVIKEQKGLRHLESGVPLKSKIILSPLDRYNWYGSVPHKFNLHVILIITCSYLASQMH